MPIYEEKLISPLAVRFTQEHIRTTFRDDRLVEDSLAEIKTRPPQSGVHDYDLVLYAPFPNIEIIRFHEPSWKAGKSTGPDERDDHWFTLDNRRLYCLQRAAAAHWPLRVAAVVDILYADTGSVWKKYDTETQGKVVTISHSIKQAPIQTWDWREDVEETSPCPLTGWEYIDPKGNIHGPYTVQQMQLWNGAGYFLPTLCMRCDPAAPFTEFEQLFPPESSVPFERFPKQVKPQDEEAFEAVLADDRKARVDALTTAPGDPNSLFAQLQGDCTLVLTEQSCVPGAHATEDRCPTPSTAAESDDSDMEATALSNNSVAAKSAISEIEKQLNDRSSNGHIWIPTWNDVYYHELGSLRRFLERQADKFIVTPGAGKKYSVELVASPVISQEPEPDYSTALAESAISEIVEQLNNDPSHKGYIWLPHWNDVYYYQLGSLRRFLESQPDKFVITAGAGKTYRVTQASPIAECREEVWDYDALSKCAMRIIEEQLNDPSRKGFIRISTWNDEYYYKLGSLRRFLESRPDKFKVTPGEGKTYGVEAVSVLAESCHIYNVKDVEWQPAGYGKKWVAKVS